MNTGTFLDTLLSRSDHWPIEQANGSDNISNLDLNFMTRHQTISYAYLIVIGTLAVIGIFGNFVVLASIVVCKPLRTTGNMFIANLSIADLCIAAIVNPFIIVGVTHGPRYFYEHLALCDIVATVCTMACSTSMWNVSFVAVNRYIFLCKHHWYRTVFAWRKTFCYCLVVWVIGGLYEVPYFIGLIYHVFDLKSMNCFYDRRNIKYSYIMSATVSIPLSVVCLSYYKIFMYVRTIRKDLTKISGTSLISIAKVREQEEIQLAKTFGLLCLFLVICWTPFSVISLFDTDDSWSKMVYMFTLALAHLNNSANPMLYGLTNKRFQNGYIYLFKSIKRCSCKENRTAKNNFEYIPVIATRQQTNNRTERSLFV